MNDANIAFIILVISTLWLFVGLIRLFIQISKDTPAKKHT